MLRFWRARRVAHSDAAVTERPAVISQADLASSEFAASLDSGSTIMAERAKVQAELARAQTQLARVQTALVGSTGEEARDTADSMSDDASDILDSVSSIISAVLHMIQDPAALPGAEYQTHAHNSVGQVGGVLADTGVDIATNLVSGILLGSAISAIVAHNVRQSYRDSVSGVPTFVHPDVSFAPDACCLIALTWTRGWRTAVILPGDPDKWRDMTSPALMSRADTVSWAKQLRDLPGICLTKIQDEALAALAAGDGAADVGVCRVAVVSEPWPPGKVKVQKVSEFRRWRYRTVRDRAEVSWDEPVYNGGLSVTSFRISTDPPPRAPASPNLEVTVASLAQQAAAQYVANSFKPVNRVVITGLDAEKRYTFTVEAVNALGSSEESETTFTF
jgi:hypothetical protein